MKTLSPFLAIGSLALALPVCAQASGYRFTNVGDFTAFGSLTVTSVAASVPCQTHLRGTTDGPGTTIRGARFSGASCVAVSPSGLPWRLDPISAHSVTLHGVTIQAATLGICGPGTLKGQITKLGKITITGANLKSSLGPTPCSVSGTLQTHPALVVVRKS